MIRRYSTIALLVFISVLALSACGGGNATPAPPAAKTFDVEATDFKFGPNAFTAKVGEAITFNVTNNGTLEHNFVVFQPSGAELGRMVIPASGSANVNLTPSVAGTFAIVCDIPGHKEAGMAGTLTVNP